jgi:hypothetical protein
MLELCAVRVLDYGDEEGKGGGWRCKCRNEAVRFYERLGKLQQRGVQYNGML